MNHLTILILGVMAITLGMAPQAEGVLARFINIKKGPGDTRFHLGELEAFEAGVVPDEAGAFGRGGATSTNDIAGVTTFNLTDGPEIGTTQSLEHGPVGGPIDNDQEAGGGVWSARSGLANSAQYTIDLGAEYEVTTVVAFARNDTCCDDRWYPLEVRLYADDGTGQPGEMTAEDTTTGGPDNDNSKKVWFFEVGADEDQDGLPDTFEQSIIDADPNDEVSDLEDVSDLTDFDNDGVSDAAEHAAQTDPLDSDSDDDGSSDGEEVAAGTDPLDEDSDNDGLLDGVESGTGTFVNASDTGTDPLDSDSDDDLSFDGQEVDGGFDPNDPASKPEISLVNHTPERVLYRRTDNLPGADFTGALPENVDQLPPFGELDEPNSLLLEGIDVDREPGGLGTDLLGDNHDLAYVFQFYDEDGVFSFTENYDDRVKVVATPIAAATNLNPRGDNQQHTDVSWNVRTYANFDFGGGGWFNVDVWLTEDGGGAQSAADIGFGYYNDFSTNTADFGGIGYTSVFGISSGVPAEFDTDGAGLSWGVYLDSFDPDLDEDGDSIPDGYEEQFFPGDLTQLGPGDFDEDGVSDPDEYVDGTDPTVADADEDGSNDGEEKAAGTDPANPDSDGDGLLDGVETGTGTFASASDTGTDPLNADTDDDGASDGFEVNENFDPNDPNSNPDIPIVQPSFVPIDELAPGAYGPDLTQNGVNYQENHYDAGVIINNAAQGNYDVHVSGDPAPLRSFDAIEPLASHGNGGNAISVQNRPWGDGGGENFTVRYNGYLDMSAFSPGTYNIHLGADDTNFFIMDTVDGQVTAQHNCCPQNQTTPFTITSPGLFPFDNVFGEQGGGDWVDIGISGPGIVGIVAIGDTNAGSPPVYPIGVKSEDTDGDDLPDAWEISWDDINDLTQLSGTGDFDNDGTSDLEELNARTNPTNDDTDGDGIPDGAETGTGIFVNASDTGTDPLNSDTDGDGLSDGVESNSGTFAGVDDTGTSPHDVDTDGDGFEDLDEVESLFDPTDPGSVPPIPQPVLLAYWNFEGQSEDQSGNGADLSIEGSAVLSPDGDGHLGEGQSLDLGAANNGAYARSEMGPWLDPAYENNAMAVSFWQYNVQVGNTSAFWLHAPSATGGERGFQAHTPWGNGTVYFDQSGCCEGPVRLTIGGVVNINQWQHFVFQRDTEGNREIWVDGVKVAEAAGGEPLDAFNGIITVGSDNTLNNSFGGRIDEMAIFDLPLHPSRIVELAEGAPVGSAPGIDPLGLAVNPMPGGEIELSWKSTLGKFYDILISPDLSTPRETWGSLPDAQDLAADPSGTNTQVISLPFPEEGFVAIREKNPPPLFSDDLETGAAGWTTIVNDDFGNTEWELGTPSGTTGPLAGAGNSASAWCTGLGDYGVESDISLRTPAIDLSGVASALLSFDAYRDADGFGDTATIRFLRSSDQSQLGEDVPIDMAIFDVDYDTIEVLVPAAAIGESVLIEFNFVSDGTLDTFSGLCLDNILVQVP